MSTSEGESTPSTSTKRVRSLRKRRSEVEVDQEREERRQANAQKKREYQARQRATETEEQRRTRLDKDRDRHRQMRAEKKKTAFHIQEPEHLPDVFYLGKRDKRCTFCGALHFVGFHNCCREGRIFINPMKKLWEPLQSLYFNEDHPNRGEFLNKILQYNTLLSMASSQHDRVLQNPFGVQSVKVRGSVHHMPSTLYPENLSHPRYGNVYIYDVNRATEYRMNEIIARDINEDILKELGQQPMIDALCYPLIHAYGEDSWRPNIPYISCSDEMNYVDRMVQVKDALLQQGIEIDWTIEVEEMELIPRGIAREIAEIESLMHVDDGGSDESDEEDYQVQQIAYHSDSDEDPDEDEHEIRDEHRNDAVNNEELHFVERNGELYPHRDTVPVVEHEQRLLADYVDDSGDDENPGDQEELLHQISLHPTAAHDTDNIIEDVTNEEDDMVYDGPSLNEPLEDATQSRHPRPKKRGQQVSYREWLLFNAQYRKGFNRALIETVERTAVDNGSPIGGIGSMTFTNNIIYPKGIKLPRAVLMERNKAAQKLLMETMNTTVDANNQDILVYDEVSMIEDMRAATSCEAAWEVSAYGTNGSSHSVFTTYIHAPDEETVIVPTGHEEEVLHRIEQQENELPSMLKAWFKINSHPPAGTEDILRDLTFCDMPKYFKYQNKKWVKKARPSEEHVIGRIKSVHPRYMEKFAIRLLAMNRKFMKSFEDLRTVDGIYYDTFVDAAKQLGLMTNEMEWQFAMQEACDTEDPINIRRLFASILIFCVPANPRQLWDQFKIDMYDRRGSSDEQKEARALFHIRSILLHHNRELVDFDLPDINESQLGNLDELNDDGSDPFLTSAQIRERAKDHESKLNDEQKDVFNAILRERSNIYGNRLFFLNGSGGCGKTFLYRALYYALKASGHNVLCTAHTGVAATLLPNGATVHRSFGIPITAEEQMESQISLETTKAEELSKVDVILWDEATMSDRRVYNCVDRLLRALHEENSEEPFGGVMIIAGGDWKQTLPIVKEVRNEGVLSYTLKKSTLWQRFVQFHLKTNMRAIDDPAYADLLLKIGQGDAQLDEDQVEIPQQTLKNTEDEVINFVFPYNEDWSNRSILTVTNEKSLQLCEMVLNNHPGEARTYESIIIMSTTNAKLIEALRVTTNALERYVLFFLNLIQ
ncbi:hypothetical protein QR680_010208 [Steinernema hermaphroditum]|uniref:ATP-dependent DNA helicase n=1 Tax=Steinernema hermaphroditum TaxID=289476 RepID=A0AA39IPT2_9BILA|nr:hypothetical protein QR680_010208 [Steinernema hermaphroditum]